MTAFKLYLPINASEARRIAQRKYENAVNAASCAVGPEAVSGAWAEERRAKRAYGAILLREDKLRRPEIYKR